MNPWLILIAVIGLIVLAWIIVCVRAGRKYTVAVSERLSCYASLAKSCPIEQVPLVFQEVTELMEQAWMTEHQVTKAHCVLSYLLGRNDEAKLPMINQIVII